MQRLLYILLILLIGISLSSNAQSLSTVIIQGTITDIDTQESLIGVHIYQPSQPSKGTVTDTEGAFRWHLPKTDSIIPIVISYTGYELLHINISTQTSQSLDFQLKPISTEMNEIVIRDEQLVAEEFTIKKLNKLDIYTNPLSKADPLLAVNAMAASTTTDESANISLRGSSPTETGVFFDGVPIYDAVKFAQINGIGTFGIFNTESVAALQVFPSNPPLEFGNTTSGLISIQTDDQAPLQNTHSISANLANLGANATLKISKKTGLRTFVNYQPSALLKLLNTNALNKLKKFYTLDAGVHGLHQFSDKTSLKIFNYTLLEGYQFHEYYPSALVQYQQQRIRNFTVASFRTRWGNNELSVKQGLSFSRMELEANNMDFQNDQQDFYSAIHLKQHFGLYQHKAGLTVDTRHSQIDGVFPQFQYAQRTEDPTVSRRASQSLSVPEVYYYGKYLLGEDWTLGGGVRKNIPLRNQQSYLSYQANLKYQINEMHSLSFSTGKYHKYELLDDITGESYVIGSQQLSLDYAFQSKHWKINAAIFQKRTVLSRMNNDIYGGELFVEYQKSRKLTANASFTYIHAMLSAGDLVYGSPYDLDFFFRSTINYTITPSWKVSTAVLWRQGSYFTPVAASEFDQSLSLYRPIYTSLEGQERLPNYQTINLNISKIFPVGNDVVCVLYGSISNVLDKKNIQGYTYNADYTKQAARLFAQRLFFMGLMINF